MKLLEVTLDQIVVERPDTEAKPKQHLCADKAYTGQSAHKAIVARHYVPHVVQRGEEIRFEKLARSHEGLLELACSLIIFRQIIVIYG